MSYFTNKILQGKIYRADIKKERHFNKVVMLGFVLLLCWTVFLYPNVFIDIRLVLIILFTPGLLLTPIFYKDLLTISGYKHYIKNNISYKITMIFLSYILITIPVGNFIVASFLFSNYIFAQQETKTVMLKPFNIGKSYSNKNRGSYSHIDVEFDGITKQINFGNTPLGNIFNKSLRIKVSKGLFGYYVIRSRTLSTK